MRALIVSHDSAGPVRFADVDEPRPAADEVVVGIHHIGLNFGELKHSELWPDGAIHGHDASGVVLEAAADGSGPGVGTRVALGMAPYAWCERVAVNASWLGVVPESVSLADAAAIGIAGVTPLRVLRTRSVLARKVLITGASGGVGHFAVQLAALAGAEVTAQAGSPERAAGLRELGARRTVTDLSTVEERFDLVLDTVGGPQLTRIWQLLANGGAIHLVGSASGQGTTFPAGALFAFGAPRTINTYGDATATSTEMGELLGLMAEGRLSAPIGRRGAWTDIDDAVQALFAREVRGKIVLDVR
jgi:NADPH2:quinone reductase